MAEGMKEATVKGWKWVYSDMTSGVDRSFRYGLGKVRRLPEGQEPVLCVRGFHFCESPLDSIQWAADLGRMVLVEVEAVGRVLRGETKCVTDAMRVVRVVPDKELSVLISAPGAQEALGNSGGVSLGCYNNGGWNVGSRNLGECNVGSQNNGAFNLGHCNLGYCNLGDRNHGNSNVGDSNLGDNNEGDGNHGFLNVGCCNIGIANVGSWHVGMFNTGTGDGFPMAFNRPASMSDARQVELPVLLRWVLRTSMPSDKDKDRMSAACHDRLRLRMYVSAENAWRTAFDKVRGAASWPTMLAELKALPNFDWDVFEEITGLARKEMEG